MATVLSIIIQIWNRLPDYVTDVNNTKLVQKIR